MRDNYQWIKDSTPLILVAIGLLAGWELLSRVGKIPRYIAPAPSASVIAIIRSAPSFGKHTWVTLQEVLLGMLVGSSLGFVLGVVIVYSKKIKMALYPIMVVSQTVPVIALAPILVVWFGFGIGPKIALVALVTFFPITVATADGLVSVDSELLRFIRSLGATEWQMFWKIRLPSALPFILTGVKVSATYCVVAAVIGEFIGAFYGLGALMMQSIHMLYMDVLYGTVIIMSAMGITLYTFVTLLERIFVPWHIERRRKI